jgi:hypothetical protein
MPPGVNVGWGGAPSTGSPTGAEIVVRVPTAASAGGADFCFCLLVVAAAAVWDVRSNGTENPSLSAILIKSMTYGYLLATLAAVISDRRACAFATTSHLPVTNVPSSRKLTDAAVPPDWAI